MRTIVLASLLSLPLAALASPISDSVGAVGEVQLSGTVSVPLYTDADGHARPVVLATIPGDEDGEDQEFFFGLASSSNVIVVSDDFVGAAGLKEKSGNKKLINIMGEDAAHKLGGEIKTVKIPVLKIGDLVLEDVQALVSSSEHSLGGVHHDLQIGMGAVPQLAWAILPSKGEVQFAEAGEAGAALVASVGTGTPTTSTDWDNPKFGKDKILASAATLLSPVTIGGVEVTASVEVAASRSSVSPNQDLQSTAHRNQADRHSYWVESWLNETGLSGWVLSTSAFRRGAHPNHKAVLGANLLSQADMAADPGSSTMAIAAAAESHWMSQTAHHLAEALAATEDKPANDEEEGGDEEESGPDTGPLKALARAYEAAGQLDKAVATWTQVTQAKGTDCSHWLSLGQAQLSAGETAEAIASLEKASELYHTWWDVDLETRTAISDYRSASESKKVKDKLKLMTLDEPAEDTPESQAGACHVADGALAAAHLASGDTDSVASLYASRLDLDPKLAQAQGTAALRVGDIQGAHAALRQAMIRESSPGVDSRVGLAMAYTTDGDWGTAEGHYLKALDIDSNDSVLAAAWVDAKVEADGTRAALKAATAWAASRPLSVPAQYAQVRAAWHAGNSSSMDEGADNAEASLNHIGKLAVEDSGVLASAARVRALAGDLDGAQQAAEAAIALDPGLAVAWLALSEAKGGDADDLAHAVSIDPLNPALSTQGSMAERSYDGWEVDEPEDEDEGESEGTPAPDDGGEKPGFDLEDFLQE